MSDTGLYGSIYEQLRETADHIDRALVNLRNPAMAERARNDLADLLGKITDAQSTDPEVRLLAVVLKQEPPGLICTRFSRQDATPTTTQQGRALTT